MNLAEWEKPQGIASVTAYRWFHDGRLPVHARNLRRWPGGRLLDFRGR